MRFYPVQLKDYPELLAELGITKPARGPFWYLSDTIVPVSILDSQITLTATQTPAVQTWITGGYLTGNQAAGQDMADTGALSAGDYTFYISVDITDGTNSFHVPIQHRNAGDTADLNQQTLYHHSAERTTRKILQFSLTLALNERIRVEIGAVTSAGFAGQASIWYHKH